MSIERALATLYLNKYEKMGCSFGISLTLFMWFVAISSNVYVFGSNFFGGMLSTLVMHYIMFFIDGTSTVADLLLLHINKKQEGSYTIQVTPLKKNKTMPLEYNLSTRYQVNENFSTIRTIIPVVITHSIIFTLYLLCAVLLRFINLTEMFSRVTIYESVFSINSMYVLAVMIVILRAPIGKKKIANKIFTKTNESSMYFKMLEKQFN
uniref:7TM GPCR serpentine receptor class x (Srx) domain-containing protein n=1 Tax=Acrobeloides nanus TaxID=290746 RepID=A0A914CRX9_9BILA